MYAALSEFHSEFACWTRIQCIPVTRSLLFHQGLSLDFCPKQTATRKVKPQYHIVLLYAVRLYVGETAPRARRTRRRAGAAAGGRRRARAAGRRGGAGCVRTSRRGDEGPTPLDREAARDPCVTVYHTPEMRIPGGCPS